VTDPAELLDLLIDRAPQLRTAGVESLVLHPDGAFDVKLRAAEPPIQFTKPDVAEDAHPHPLDDPETFGGAMPKRRPLLQRDDEE